MNAFYTETPPFLDELIHQCKENRIDLRWFSVDHVCMRVSNELAYLLGNQEMEEYKAEIVGTRDQMIWWRLITLRKLPVPLIYDNIHLDKQQVIDILELPAPKAVHKYKDWIQHAEFFSYHHPVHTWNFKRFIEDLLHKFPFVAREKNFDSPFNPTIAHSFTKDLEIKIHPNPIDWVVKQEEGLLTPVH